MGQQVRDVANAIMFAILQFQEEMPDNLNSCLYELELLPDSFGELLASL
jgi:hypothetical protein